MKVLFSEKIQVFFTFSCWDGSPFDDHRATGMYGTFDHVAKDVIGHSGSLLQHKDLSQLMFFKRKKCH